MKGIESIEQYLSSIDIALLERPEIPIDSIESLVSFLGAKDEKEAIGAMYKTLALLEIYFNRITQYILITFYNSDKANGDKPITPYFDSEFTVLNELVQEYQQLVLNQNKKFVESVDVKTNEDNKVLMTENEKLKKKCAELTKELEKAKETEGVMLLQTTTKDQDEYSLELSKLEKEVEELNNKIVKEKENNEDCLNRIGQYEIDNKALQEEIEEIKALSIKKSNAQDNQDAYENILKTELKVMRCSFEKKIALLNTSIEDIRNDFRKKEWNKDKDIKELRETNKVLQKRLKELTKTSTNH